MSNNVEINKYIYSALLPGIDNSQNKGRDGKMRDKAFIDTTDSLAKRNLSPEIVVSDFALACGAAVDRKKTAEINVRDVKKMGNSGSVANITHPHIVLKASAFSNAYPFGPYQVSKQERTLIYRNWVWPQSIYHDTFKLDSMLANSELTKTGRKYPYTFDDAQGPAYCEEYEGEVDGRIRRFVKIKAKATDVARFSDGSAVEDRSYWFEVEPITWRINCDNETLDHLNTRGYASIPDKTPIDITPAEGIITGLPVNGNDYSLSQTRNFLNGYGEYAGNGFFDISVDSSRTPTKNRNKFQVSVQDGPMTIDEQLRFYIDNKLSIMLHGRSGVGKSRRVKDIDPDCVMIQLRDGILPEEVIGKTAYNEQTKESSWIEPTWYRRIKEVCANDPERNHVLFIDEITNVRQYEQSLVYHIVLERSIDGNYGKLPDNCVVIAAGNSTKESDVASPMPEPLFRRFNAHIELPLDLQDWLEWGSVVVDGKPRIHPLVASFVAAYSDKVFYTKYDKEKSEFAIDPRGWEQLSNIIYDNNGVIREALISNKIGKENAKSFISFAKMPLITIDDIMNNDVSSSDIPTNTNAKYALMLSLRVADMTEVKQVRLFIKRYLGAELLATFDSLWATDDEKIIYLDKIDHPENYPDNELGYVQNNQSDKDEQVL